MRLLIIIVNNIVTMINSLARAVGDTAREAGERGSAAFLVRGASSRYCTLLSRAGRVSRDMACLFAVQYLTNAKRLWLRKVTFSIAAFRRR